MHAQFLRERHNVLAALQPLHRHPAELVRITSHSFLCHFAVPFPAQCAIIDCLTLRVHSTVGLYVEILRISRNAIVCSPMSATIAAISPSPWQTLPPGSRR